MSRCRAGVLGATGLVGQQLLVLLAEHPWFEVTALAASARSAGKPYGEAVDWKLDAPLPQQFHDLVVKPVQPELECDFVFSVLDASVAGAVEEEFARAGHAVVSNSRNHRMDDDVPLLIPEVNPDHCVLIEHQRERRRGNGFIVTNPNCAATGLALALKPLDDAFGVRRVRVVTFQALSGAGSAGVSAGDILGNVIPFISGEEEKLEAEPRKILGRLEAGAIRPANFVVSAQCSRVPVAHGHLEAVSVEFAHPASPEAVREALASFAGEPQRRALPSAPAPPIIVREEDDRPQPRRDCHTSGRMAVVVGRIRPCPLGGIRFWLLSHNLVRGAAGAAVLNAELLAALGYLGCHAAWRRCCPRGAPWAWTRSKCCGTE
jgi:aspartate-semialdehyde dehydrogenase